MSIILLFAYLCLCTVIHPAAGDPETPRKRFLQRSGSISSSIFEQSPRDGLELCISDKSADIVKRKLSSCVEENKLNGLGALLQTFLDNAEDIYNNEEAMHDPKETLKQIITKSVKEAHEKAVEYTRSPAQSIQIRSAQWSVFRFLVAQVLNEKLNKSIPHLTNNTDFPELRYIGQGIFRADEQQTNILQNYIIAFTFLLSEHEIKDPGSFCEEYKDLLPVCSPDREKKKCQLQ